MNYESAIAPVIRDYLALKRALGRKYVGEGYILAGFDRFLVRTGATESTVAAEAFDAWCLGLAHLRPSTRRFRMRVVRNLCLYARRTVPGCFVPDLALFRVAQPARRPYIFSHDEIATLLRAASALPERVNSPWRAQSYRLAVVLLYTAGLRRGELCRLVLSDYDSNERTLLIRSSKFHKSRLVALSADASRELDAFLIHRREIPHGPTSPLLLGRYHGELRARSGGGFGGGMRRLFRHAGIVTVSGCPPRVHDLRHTHAVHALQRWYADDEDVQARLPALAASMGHVSIASTAYYLSFLEPVAEAASERFAAHCAAILAEDAP